ncbi:hypothetical protein [Neorhizobium galegae]|uniref:hypothetical protein n=1 Tax=Neorhizobium galegae TaxID=399 RepID=UPI001F18DA6D|nr:hypothetical protein [Neorhizobium galegae]UIK04987.1 hypothetical protein LZK81_20420 [Neorhizobium galegae]
MLQNHNHIAGAFEPEDLQMLQQVLEKICDQRGIIKSSGGAADIATDVINLFQLGVRREDHLLARLDPRAEARS